MADTPALPERLSGECRVYGRSHMWRDGDRCLCGAWHPRFIAVASPRREAPADRGDVGLDHVMDEEAVGELAAVLAWEGDGPEAGRFLNDEQADEAARMALWAIVQRRINGYQLVPDGHHVSPEGQTVWGGQRYDLQVGDEHDCDDDGCLNVTMSPTDPVRPVGTEEADTE